MDPETVAAIASARANQVLSLVFAGTAAVCVWDVLNNLNREYKMFSKPRFRPSVFAYLASRIGSLVYSLGLATFATTPFPDCLAAIHAFESFYPITTAGSSFLFYYRLRAVYAGNRAVAVLFGILWLGVLTTAVFIPVNGRAQKVSSNETVGLAGTENCVYSRANSVGVGPAAATTLVFDTLVFVAISYRLAADYNLDTGGVSTHRTRFARFRRLFSGANLPAFSKGMLSDGQEYYMITVLVNATVTIVAYLPAPKFGHYHGIGVMPSLVVTSIMACRVYRRTMLGLMGGGMEPQLPTLNGDLLTLTVPESGIRPSLPVEFALDDLSAGGVSDSKVAELQSGSTLEACGLTSESGGSTLNGHPLTRTVPESGRRPSLPVEFALDDLDAEVVLDSKVAE